MVGACHGMLGAKTYVTLAPYSGKYIDWVNQKRDRMDAPEGALKLTVFCSTCDQIVVPFVVTGELNQPLDSECHPRAEVWVYLHGDNQDVITVNCAEKGCEKEIARFKYLGAVPKESR